MDEVREFVFRSIPATTTSFPLLVLNSTPTMLLHMEGVDGSVSFPDAMGIHTVAAHGTAQVDTAQFKFGTASALMSPTLVGRGNEWLDVQYHPDFNVEMGDFTVDFWLLEDVSIANSSRNFFDLGTTTANNQCLIYCPGGAGTTSLRVYNGSFTIIEGVGTGILLTPGTWCHIALTRANQNLRLFQNGIQVGSTYSGPDQRFGPYLVGPRIGNDFSGVFNTVGWIDEFRFINGWAAWTSNFVPPSGGPYSP